MSIGNSNIEHPTIRERKRYGLTSTLGQTILYAESFSPNTPEGACPTCHGLGRIYDATEKTTVPDDRKTIRKRDRRVAAGLARAKPARHRHDAGVRQPWRDLSRKDRDWLLFTDEQVQVPVYAGWDRDEVRAAIKRKELPSYMGTFTGARKYVLQTFATTQSF